MLDDRTKQNKAFPELAKVLTGVKILTAREWEKVDDKWAAKEIQKGLKTPEVSKAEVKKALQKMRS